MNDPVDVLCDRASGCGYVRYQAPHADIVSTTIRLTPDVLVDFAADGSIVGIELLSLDDDTLNEARDFATKHGLALPTVSFVLS